MGVRDQGSGVGGRPPDGLTLPALRRCVWRRNRVGGGMPFVDVYVATALTS